jgi:hypothetical protein
MFVVDSSGTLPQYLGDPALSIPQAHLKLVCRVSQAGAACRYIVKTTAGSVCIKNTPAKSYIDDSVKRGLFKRNMGDNCEGFGCPEVVKTSR